jgi:AcrR family transcriptional regulator
VIGRPRTVSDEQIFAAAARVIAHDGPGGLTLAAVAREAGLSPSALVQRFGSKRGLLLALSGRAPAEPATRFAAVRERTASPVQALRAGLVEMAAEVTTPEELVNHLAYLQLELADPEFHQHVLGHARALLNQLRALLLEAMAAGDLDPHEPSAVDDLARSIYVAYNGALVSWAVLREGSLPDWVGREVDARLAARRRAGAPDGSGPTDPTAVRPPWPRR